MTKGKYFTIPELAKLTGVSRIAIYKKVKKGQISAIRIGRNYVISDNIVSEILGTEISADSKRQINTAVKKTVEQYGDVIKELSTK